MGVFVNRIFARGSSPLIESIHIDSANRLTLERKSLRFILCFGSPWSGRFGILSKFLFSFAVIAFGLSLGYLIQTASSRGLITLPVDLDRLRKLLQKVALLFVNPVTVAGTIWIVDIKAVSLAALPVLGAGAILLGGAFALLASKIMGLESRQAGAFFACGSFTNIGSIGALICFMFLGEKGFALVPIYKLFEEGAYYGIGFPVARYFSSAHKAGEKPWQRLRGMARDPFIIVALSAIILGGVLNTSGLGRPAFFHALNSVFIPTGAMLLLVSIGLAMKFKRLKRYFRECLAVSAIKFLLVPLTVFSAAYLIGFGEIEGGLPLRVVIILSAMPVAFNALIPPSIYDLDLDLANSCWFFTTTALVVVLPTLLLVVNSF
jgi:predicted permease